MNLRSSKKGSSDRADSTTQGPTNRNISWPVPPVFAPPWSLTHLIFDHLFTGSAHLASFNGSQRLRNFGIGNYKMRIRFNFQFNCYLIALYIIHIRYTSYGLIVAFSRIQTLTDEEKRDSVGVIGKSRTLEPFLPTFWQDFQNILGFSIQFWLCSRPKNNAKNWGRFWSHASSTSSPADWFCPVVSTDQYVFQIWLVLCPWFLLNISPCLLFLVIKFHALMVVMSGCWLYTLFTPKGSKFAKKELYRRGT